MRDAPRYIDGARVLLVADLECANPTGNTRHLVDGLELLEPAALAIAQYDGEAGVYLFYCNDQWRALTDTYHESLTRAVSQAEFEFEPVEFRSLEAGNTQPMTVGLALSSPDNESYMLSDEGSHPTCQTCGLVTDRTWIDPEFELVVPQFDASYTYDGYLIVSERLRLVAETPGTRFIPLPSVPGFYSLVFEAVVPFDVERRTVFEQPCGACERFYVVAGATPVFLRTEDPLPDELFRTDVEFGTGNEQSPIAVMGHGLGERLRSANLAGVDLRPAQGLSD